MSGKRLERDRVDALDQVRALGECRQRDAGGQVDGRRRQPGELEAHGLDALVLAEAAVQEEVDAVGPAIRYRDVEGDLAGRPGTLRDDARAEPPRTPAARIGSTETVAQNASKSGGKT